MKHAIAIGLLLLLSLSGSSFSLKAQESIHTVDADKARVDDAEGKHLPEGTRGYLWAVLADDYQQASDFSHAEDAYNKALHLLERNPADRGNYATTLDNLGSLYLTYSRIDDAERCRRTARDIRQKAGDRLGVARSEAHLATVALIAHRFKEAAAEADQAYIDLNSAGDTTWSDRISTLVTSSIAHCKRNDCTEAQRIAEQALTLARDNFREDSVQVAHSLLALGMAQSHTGATVQAEQSMLEGVRILNEKYRPDSPIVLGAMYEYRNFLEQNHRKPEADALTSQLDPRLAAMRSQCTTCSASVFGLMERH